MSEVREAAVHFEAVKTSMSQSKQGTILRVAIHPNDVPPSLHTDWVGSRYMVAMVKLNDEDQPEMSEDQREAERLIASAGMLCRNPAFSDFLHDRGYMDDNSYIAVAYEGREAPTVKTLRGTLGVDSRSELKTNSQAREKFKSLSEEFVRWKQGLQE